MYQKSCIGHMKANMVNALDVSAITLLCFVHTDNRNSCVFQCYYNW